MNTTNSIKDIPSKFTIASIPHTVEIIDGGDEEEHRYGYYAHAECKLVLYTKVYGVQLTDEQILNTFEHELMHAFQFYYDNEFNEGQAQSFANMRREFELSKR